jgi:YD repeat-containing protein
MFRVQLNPPNTGVPCGSQSVPQLDRMSVSDEAPELDFALDLAKLPTETGMVPVDGTGLRGQYTTYPALVDAYQRRLHLLFIGPAATTSDPPLAVTYNSGNSSSGGFGPGWSGYFERRVTVIGSASNVSVLGDNGESATYQKVGTAPGYYDVPKGGTNRLQYTGSGWLETLATGVVMQYDSSGACTASLAGGRRWTITSDASSPPHWKRIEHPVLNRRTTFTYNAGGRIVKATDSTNRVTTFGYDPTTSMLRQIRVANVAPVTMTYQNYSGTQLLASVLNPDNTRTSFAYDSTFGPTWNDFLRFHVATNDVPEPGWWQLVD